MLGTTSKARAWLAASDQFEASVIEEIFAKAGVFGEDGSGFTDTTKEKIFKASAMNPIAHPAPAGGAPTSTDARCKTEELINEVDSILREIS